MAATPLFPVRIPVDLRDAVKACAAENGETITDVILRALRDYVTPSTATKLEPVRTAHVVQAVPTPAPSAPPRPARRSPGHPFAGIGKRCIRCGMTADEH